MEKRGSGLMKICDLSVSLDGYKEELHTEFTSEANVFYTTIKNVSYPPKNEIGGVNMGSSKTNMGNSSSQHDSLVAMSYNLQLNITFYLVSDCIFEINRRSSSFQTIEQAA